MQTKLNLGEGYLYTVQDSLSLVLPLFVGAAFLSGKCRCLRLFSFLKSCQNREINSPNFWDESGNYSTAAYRHSELYAIYFKEKTRVRSWNPTAWVSLQYSRVDWAPYVQQPTLVDPCVRSRTRFVNGGKWNWGIW